MAQPVCPSPGAISAADDNTVAWNTVVLTSLGYHVALGELRRGVSFAHGHGLSVADICAASQLDPTFVHRLLGEADL